MIEGREAAVRAVKEQNEIGILLALSVLLDRLSFGPWIPELFYRRQYLPATYLLLRFNLGGFGRAVS